MYLPATDGAKGPVDRRRFGRYLELTGLQYTLNPSEKFTAIFCAGSGDLQLALKLKAQRKIPLIYDYANHHCVETGYLKNYSRSIYKRIKNGHNFYLNGTKAKVIELINYSDLVNYYMEISEIKEVFIASNQKYSSLRGYL